MSVFSAESLVRTSGLCDVMYPNQFGDLVGKVSQKQLSKEEVDDRLKDSAVFEHSTLGLRSLFDKARQFGEPLSIPERGTIQTFIDECRIDVESLEAKISESITTIGSLCRTLSEASCLLVQRKQQTQLGGFLLSATIAPIQLLPQDILEEIFSICADWTQIERPNALGAHLQLTSVCHRWRTIALGLPGLWRYATFDTSSSYSFDLLKFQLNLCRFPLLSLHVHGRSSSLDKFTTLLAEQSIQIRALDVSFSTEDEAITMLPTVLETASSELEEFVMVNPFQLADLPIASLKRLYVPKLPVSWTNSAPPPHITILFITYPIHWTFLEHMLLHCTQLQQVVVSVGENGPQSTGTPAYGLNPSHSNPCVLSDLEYLSFVNDCEKENIPSDFLKGFSFPALRAFEYYVEHKDRDQPGWFTSHDILPRIYRLTLQIPHITQEILMKYLESAYMLEELSILSLAKNLEEVVQFLIDVPASYPQRVLLPQLKAVQFGSQSDYTDVHQFVPKIRQLVEAWTLPVHDVEGRPHHLTYLKMMFWDQGEKGVVELRDVLLKDGPLNIKIEIVTFMTRWRLLRVPVGFEMYQHSFSDVRKRRILSGEGDWKTRYGSVFHIRD